MSSHPSREVLIFTEDQTIQKNYSHQNTCPPRSPERALSKADERREAGPSEGPQTGWPPSPLSPVPNASAFASPARHGAEVLAGAPPLTFTNLTALVLELYVFAPKTSGE